jgi:hypothetical protein
LSDRECRDNAALGLQPKTLNDGSSCVTYYYSGRSNNVQKKADESQVLTYIDIDTFLENN